MMNWIYENNDDNTCRYVLGTTGNKPLVCIGINPSTAEPSNLDNTIKSVERVAEANGFDSWIMLNVYPQRATDPDDMHTHKNYKLVNENLIHVDSVLKNNQVALWAAWGTVITKRPYLMNCLCQIADISIKYNCKWYRAGESSKSGHPHHPLYLKKNEKLIDFNIDQYIKEKSNELIFSNIKSLENRSIDYESEFLQLLGKADLIDPQYARYFKTAPIDMDVELKALNNADYKLTRALLTGIMREDHFANGSLIRRIENGDLISVLKRLRKLRQEINNVI